jgi:hypothetical protein
MNLHSSYMRPFNRRMEAILLACASMACVVLGQTGDTNALAMWLADPSLVWSGETNGFRVVIDVWPESPANEVNIYVVSSRKRPMVYVLPPSGKPPRMELRGTNGVIVQPLNDKIDGILPNQLPVEDFPRSSHNGIYNYLLMGQGSPSLLKQFSLSDVYQINREEDYTLTVFPEIYKFETNYQYADRVDLPRISTTVHLKPPDQN